MKILEASIMQICFTSDAIAVAMREAADWAEEHPDNTIEEISVQYDIFGGMWSATVYFNQDA